MPVLPLPNHDDAVNGGASADSFVIGDTSGSIEARLLRRMWSEFVEMPGLRLTRAQAQRLWGVDPQTCQSALDELVALNLLVRGADDKYSRPSAVSDQTHGPRARSEEQTSAVRRAG